jgi:hypothetical protein
MCREIARNESWQGPLPSLFILQINSALKHSIFNAITDKWLGFADKIAVPLKLRFMFPRL